MKAPDFDPRLFTADAISAETAAFNARIAAMELDAPAREDLDLAIERAGPPGGGILELTRSDRGEDRSIQGPGGEIGLRLVRPATAPIGVYLHFHGGGFSLGSASGQDAMLESVADNAGLVAISVDYRLAPEHPYPAPVADAEAAAWWAIRHAEEEFGAWPVVLGGESAGAYLSIAAALRLRDRRGFKGLAGLNLCQGGYDMNLTPSMRAGERTAILTVAAMRNHLTRFLRDERRDDPAISPLYANLRDLPDALFTAGTADPLLDDSMFMYCRWIAAGNRGELAVYPGAVHGFTYLPMAISRDANGRIEQFLRDCCQRACR